jgi:hypothetical protein
MPLMANSAKIGRQYKAIPELSCEGKAEALVIKQTRLYFVLDESKRLIHFSMELINEGFAQGNEVWNTRSAL